MEKDKKKTLLPKSSLIIRLVAGMYLVYLSYQLFMGLGSNTAENAPLAVSLTAAIGFGICGLILVITNIREFLRGNFQGGILDVSEKESPEGEADK